MIPEDFACDWESAWNSHDIDRILEHYSSDIVFRSRKAIPILGKGELQGKSELHRYWAKALAKQPDLRFEVQSIYFGHDMMVIAYRNHKGVEAAETLHFDQDGLVIQASACHADGAEVS